MTLLKIIMKRKKERTAMKKSKKMNKKKNA